MKEKKYTKGKWTVVDMDLDNFPISVVSNEKNKVICQCFYDNDTFLKSEAVSNANIISAAPDLLEAL